MMMLHISDLKKFVRCPRLYLTDRDSPPREYRPFVRLDEEVTELAAGKIGAVNAFRGQRGDEPEKALEAAVNYDWLVSARFAYMDLRVKVPFLHRNEDGWDIYFMFIGLFPHPYDMEMYCDTVWVLKKNGLKIKDYYIIHLNSDYVRQGELDPDQLFRISDCFYNHKNHPMIPVREAVEKNMKDLTDLILRVQACGWDTVQLPVRTSRCVSRQKCRYYDSCFPEEKEGPANSIITLITSHYRYDMKAAGIEYLADADPDLIEGSRQQYSQIVGDQNGGLFVDRPALCSWLSYVKYPITFIDFEWERFAIPPYDEMHPFDVLPFEYSIHILHEDGTVTHTVFLSVHDDRREFAEGLIRDVPSEGTLVAYNAEGAEKIRLEELALQFPEYAGQLRDMISRMEDLQLPFSSGTVYDVRMRGFWSLKTIMSMMDDEGYKNLDIREGMDAVFQWRLLDYDDESADTEKITEDLKAYCGMDSYAMTVVYKWLLELAGG